MAESSATRIALASFSRTSLRRYASTDVEDLLSKVDKEAPTFIHAVHPGVALAARILEHFQLPPSLAGQIIGAAPLELDTSAETHHFKKFRFIEEAGTAAARVDDNKRASILIRGSETDRLVEAGGCVIVGAKFVLLFEGHEASPLLGRAVEGALHRERELREHGIEYLLYRLAKGLFVDNYFDLMHRRLDRLQALEAPLLEGSTDANIYREVTRLRRELNPFERSLIHAAEFSREVSGDKSATPVALRHLSTQLDDDVERLEKELSMLRERTSELIQTHRDNVSAELNNVMRSLTVISAIFLPLSFITSFYGMNFTAMPAFTWRGGFPLAVTLMLAIAVGALTYARRKKWI